MTHCEAPRILHLATHGFFLKDQNFSCVGNVTAEMGMSLETVPNQQYTQDYTLENPMLRSGIALAGANNSLNTEDLENSDGIVTAEKILSLNLWGTDMVVLSACNTGVGDVKTGEGVYGLRRAFIQAGAKSLVMSLWKVRDKETKELMVEFYRNIQSGMNRCQALRHAALAEMEIVKKRYGMDIAPPFFWGGFIFLGEP